MDTYEVIDLATVDWKVIAEDIIKPYKEDIHEVDTIS